MNQVAKDAWIQGTKSAPMITPLDLQPEQIQIDDVTHALGFLCRYTGRTSRFYSVAEHSMIVWHAACELGLSEQARRWALAHDFGEAFLNDVANPVKRTFVFEEYRKLETEIDNRIRARFSINVDAEELAAVRMIDVESCNVERWLLLGPPPRAWNMPTAPIGVTEALEHAWCRVDSDLGIHRTSFDDLREYFRDAAHKVLG